MTRARTGRRAKGDGINQTNADSVSKVRGLIQCHSCRLICRDAEHYLSHKCEPKLPSDGPILRRCLASLDSPSAVSDCTDSTDSQNGKYRMDQPAGQYVVSYESQPLRKRTRRHYWMICREHNPDELVSWGNAPTQELAEMAAMQEVTDLSSGLSHGGRVASTCYSGIHHC